MVNQKKSSDFLQLFILTCFIFTCNPSIANKIVVYEHKNYQGWGVEVDISQCSNLIPDIAGKVTSIDTKNMCTRFYAAENCSGSFIEVMARSPFHANLEGWGFNDKAISVSPCPHECDQSITGETPNADERVNLTMYDKRDFKGAYGDLNVQGCTTIPAKFTDKLLSAKVYGRCIQFYNNLDCKDSGPGVDTIELRQGTQRYHRDISLWAFHQVRAVSHCTYKCNGTMRKFHKRRNQNSSPTPYGNYEVILFDEKNFTGDWKRFTVDGCVELLHDWEGVAASLKTFNNLCVTLYDRRGCTGDILTVLGSNPDPDLSKKSFDGLTRSMGLCSGSDSSLIKAIIIILSIFGAITSIFLVLLIVRQCTINRNKSLEKLSEKEIDEFRQGLGLNLETNDDGDEIEGDYSAELLAQNRPYNEAYEILRPNIKYDAKSPLGTGQFGIVYKGTLQILSPQNDQRQTTRETIQVAIKTVRPGSTTECLRSLMKEIKTMLYLGNHDHILQMIGCCTENLQGGEILVLMEYCARGSLEAFLQKNRNNFRNIVRKGRLCEESTFNNVGYVNSPHINSATINLDQGVPRDFDFFQLLRWCIEIAAGMEYLASRKVLHCDLAARNILLDENFQTKIADFGLSRQLYCFNEYIKKGHEPLPWRWLAIESLNDMEFSTKSDVWSYGVLCWEIFNLGEKPYPGVAYNDDFLRNLKDGSRLAKPKYAVYECYNLMTQCWHEDPNNRPNFSDILEELQDISSSLRSPQAQSSLSYSNSTESH